MAWSDVVGPIRLMLTGAADDMRPVVIRTLPYRCWRCGTDNAIPAVLHAEGFADTSSLFDTGTESVLGYVRALLVLTEQSCARTIKPRSSKTAGATYLSHGCLHCDAIFGTFPISEELRRNVYENPAGAAELPVLLTIDRPNIELWALTCDYEGFWEER